MMCDTQILYTILLKQRGARRGNHKKGDDSTVQYDTNDFVWFFICNSVLKSIPVGKNLTHVYMLTHTHTYTDIMLDT